MSALRENPVLMASYRRARGFWFKFQDFMTVPLYASIASLVVPCIPPIQNALKNHMQPVTQALQQAGDCSIPITMVVLGAYFYNPRPKPQPEESRISGEGSHVEMHGIDSQGSIHATNATNRHSEGRGELPHPVSGDQEPRRRPAPSGERRTVLAAILSRMILTPALILPAMALLAKFRVHPVMNE